MRKRVKIFLSVQVRVVLSRYLFLFDMLTVTRGLRGPGEEESWNFILSYLRACGIKPRRNK